MSGKKIAIILLLSGLILLFVSACGSSVSAARIKPTWIKSQISGDSVSVSVSEVEKDKISHFKVSTTYGDLSYMAYTLDGQLYARADICPPCRSQSFSLKGNTLVCDACGTVFDARTGSGISGACVRYPKAAVSYTINGDGLVMKAEDLIAAYRTTLQGS